MTLCCSYAVAVATPVHLNCNLTQLEHKADAKVDQTQENRQITVVFDEQNSALTVQQSGPAQVLQSVSITQSSISGFTNDVSLGIDRSSLSIVFQTYSAESTAEFGTCKLSAAALP